MVQWSWRILPPSTFEDLGWGARATTSRRRGSVSVNDVYKLSKGREGIEPRYHGPQNGRAIRDEVVLGRLETQHGLFTGGVTMDPLSRSNRRIFLTHIKWLTYGEPSGRCFPFLCCVLEENKYGFRH